MNKLNFKYMKVSDLKPYGKNPRKNEKAVDNVMNSIKSFGFKVPIVADSSGVIVCGHTRLKAAQKLNLDTVPVIIADDLNDEQIKAFRLADNKVSEKAEWDFDLLDDELNDILNIDMEDFGFEFMSDEEHENNAIDTQFTKANILNLEYGQFYGDNPFDIPDIEPVDFIPEVTEWIGFNYVMTDKHPEGKGVHFFLDDYQFERLWNNPQKYLKKLKKYAVVAAPDFSPYGDMPLIAQMWNHYRKHWVAAWLQSNGVTVIPTIRASTDPRSFDFYLMGEPKNGVVIISNMWTRDEESKSYFLKEFEHMKETLHPTEILVYGKHMDELKDVTYIETFIRGRFKT